VRAIRNVLLLGAVALAFADSSIVVLALPELLDRFDTEIAPVSWVITSYNLALAGGALAAIPLVRHLGPQTAVRSGALLFAAASGACAASSGLWMLVGFRAAQGAGGAVLLTAALPLLGRSGPGRWALAAAFGAAAGPALGGALTEAFDWRAIFIAQAPVALVALAAPGAPGEAEVSTRPSDTFSASPSLLRLGPRLAASLPPLPSTSKLSQGLGANLALALLSGALVGALFLVVVLLVDVWGLTPLGAAGVATALPAGTLVAAALPARTVLAAGLLALAAGLAGLSLLPDDAVGWPVAALVLCGLGTGVAAPTLTRSALARGAAVSVCARHLGLVLALVAVAPLLAADLDDGGTRAKLVGTARVLDAPVAAETKVPLAVDLVRAIDRAPRGKLPDFAPEFAKQPPSVALRDLETDLEQTLRAVITRSFRNSFFLCAGFALLALAPLALLRRRA
jgi:MFS family permease